MIRRLAVAQHISSLIDHTEAMICYYGGLSKPQPQRSSGSNKQMKLQWLATSEYRRRTEQLEVLKKEFEK